MWAPPSPVRDLVDEVPAGRGLQRPAGDQAAELVPGDDGVLAEDGAAVGGAGQVAEELAGGRDVHHGVQAREAEVVVGGGHRGVGVVHE